MTVRAQPGASKNAITGVVGDAIQVRVTAPPVDGRANDAVGDLLAETLDVPRRAVTLTRGGSGRRKVFDIEGVDVATARRKLSGAG